ncbi:MAG: diheme cytochrome c [Gammaproteobacteria bacterium]|nr:diheme cytochrome c [Gammaproteobacteria bacterium]MBU1646130.1 diheme cytochrome c [Gammaproteobacteria bacterium]MBU1972192.1 diheme cytochrome c [Gammaproteobacteria bacterium]
MNKTHKILALLALAAGATAATPTLAGGHAYGPFPASYIEECASCHVAYPPQLLTAPGWAQVMLQLDQHYGVDAGLDAKRRTAIADFLQRNASRRDKHAATAQPPRLAQTPWFRKEHGPLPQQAGKTLPAAAQCESCHRAAEHGDYTESGLRLPAGYRHMEH